MRSVDLPKAARAQSLRREMTAAERKLWYKLRDRRLGGHKFVRQQPIGRYFADFACREARLVVEVDGGQHAESVHDDIRDAVLVLAGYKVLRFWNAEILVAIDDACETILAAIDGRLESYDRFKERRQTLLPACGEKVAGSAG